MLNKLSNLTRPVVLAVLKALPNANLTSCIDAYHSENRQLTHLMLRCIYLSLMPRSKVLQRMSTRHASSWDSWGSAALHHTGYHRACLGDLRAPRCYASMHRLPHSSSGLLPTTRYTLIGGMALGHREATVSNYSMSRQTRLMAGKRWSHTCHHDWQGSIVEVPPNLGWVEVFFWL